MMKSLSDTLARFEPPKISQEKLAEIEQWERAEEQRHITERLLLTGIPKKYRNADIDKCQLEISTFADDLLRGIKDFLIIRGKVGRGKTYSACAILRAVCPVMLARFTTAIAMLDAIRATFKSTDSEEVARARYTHVPLLVIDDLGKEKPTEWMLSTIFSIIDERYSFQRATIITTQYEGKELIDRLTIGGDSETAKAILSRLSEGLTVVLEGDDRRLAK